MTTQKTEERIAHLKSIILSESSRTRMREELRAYADMHSVPALAPVATRTSSSVPSPYFSYFSARFFRVSAALVVLISTLGGTAYAANDAKPGQALYPVKLNVTEPVQTALIPSTEGKAAWHAILAERRLEEATDLAVAGTLDSNTQVAIADNFTKHVQDSSNAAAQLQQEGNVTAALSARSDLEARIVAHADILSQVVTHLANNPAVDTSSEVATKGLLAVVQDSQTAVVGERLALEDSLNANQEATSTSATAKVAVSASSTSDVAIAMTNSTRASSMRLRFMMKAAMSTSLSDSSRTARDTEIQAILFKNTALLKSIGIVATSTATTSSSTPAMPPTTNSEASTTNASSGEIPTTENTNLK